MVMSGGQAWLRKNTNGNTLYNIWKMASLSQQSLTLLQLGELAKFKCWQPAGKEDVIHESSVEFEVSVSYRTIKIAGGKEAAEDTILQG